MKRVLIVVLLALPLLGLLLVRRSLDYGLGIGDMLPEARLEALDRAAVNTASWHGRPTLLILFSPDCPACKEEIRTLSAIAPDLPGARIVLLTLNGQPPKETADFQIVRDPEGTFAKRTRKLLVPTIYWIGPSGRIKYARTGVRPPSSDRALFSSLLGRDHD